MKKILFTVALLISFPLFATEYDDLVRQSFDLMNEDPDKSAKLIDDAIQMAPELGAAYIMKGMYLFRVKNDPTKAGVEFKKGVGKQKDPNERLEYIRIINELTSNFSSQEDYDSYKEGFKLVDDGKSNEAVKLFQKLLANNKNNYLLYYELGFTNIELGNYEKAMYYLLEGRRINPVARNLLNELKYLYSHNGDVPRLQEITDDITLYYGDSPDLRHELAYAYSASQKNDKAVEMLEKNIVKYPEYYQSYYMLGQLYYNTKEYKKAKPVLKSFIDNAKKEDFKNDSFGLDFDKLMKSAKEMYEACK